MISSGPAGRAAGRGPARRRPRSAARWRRGCGRSAEAVAGLRTGLGQQLGRVGEVGGVVDGMDLQHQAYGAGDQLLLVGLDAERDGHQVRPVVAPARTDRAIRCCSWSLNASGLRGSVRGGRRRRATVASSAGVVRGMVSTTASSRPRTMPSAVASSKPSQARSAPARRCGARRRRRARDLPVPPLGVGRKRPRRPVGPISAAPASSATEDARRSGRGPCRGPAARRDRHHDGAALVGELDRALPGRSHRNLAGPVTGTKLMHVSWLARQRAQGP